MTRISLVLSHTLRTRSSENFLLKSVYDIDIDSVSSQTESAGQQVGCTDEY